MQECLLDKCLNSKVTNKNVKKRSFILTQFGILNMNLFETKILKIVTAQVEFFGTRSWKYSGAEEGVVSAAEAKLG